jgi:hypothetical protein
MGVRLLAGEKIVLYITASTPALGPTQNPIQWLPVTLSPGIKQQKRETHHSPPSSSEVKGNGAKPPLSHTSSWRSA